ncbi:sn-glycerol-3-phosphate ABC transporter ATP-binding protein UgpC [Facklamia sp. DSM 111018]|uniref:Sn-glycerol-3-phosphate ABC transporter ATP-binding protein UgpC n=1 Tax=Facklamia lactis TaxID=2749967 RepID=A0ABS0LQZ8_9LACT|nr:sn-glycerol-3-phosphate ABC transporter ATP-binding protein UgpC [Facklamia lactis]MBG9979606.1 sn-glycerol-3-phosphate ABC transporter ATP-binding protein UgpC [Facklamia lactis]MBG9985714.1 sn-glycerol-3-phosphate ABC transporter ATP-binding protein UgpC [Facklamia lactis]
MSGIELRNIYKDYLPGIHAVTNLNLTIEDGEFVVFVGPSGCGKSTTLRMIAGLEDITAGEIYIDGEKVNHIHPKDRNIAMVFQNYALYPHMTVAENMGFGLKMKKMGQSEIDQRVEEVAKSIGLEDFLERLPKELSGGQRQRVALGRAIARKPKVFLMDEPLSNLDAKLRGQTRAEIIQLTRDLGITTVYVTHDQVEAMTMADRIVIMNNGFIQQVGSPRELYLDPDNKFVAGFMGSPAMNFIEVEITPQGLMRENWGLPIPETILDDLINKGYLHKTMTLGIRPENIHLARERDHSEQSYSFSSEIKLAEMLGSETLVHFDMAGQPMVAKLFTLEAFDRGQAEDWVLDFDYVHFFDGDTEQRVLLTPAKQPASISI